MSAAGDTQHTRYGIFDLTAAAGLTTQSSTGARQTSPAAMLLAQGL